MIFLALSGTLGVGQARAQCSGNSAVTIDVEVGDSSIVNGLVGAVTYADGNLYGGGQFNVGSNTLNLSALVANGSTTWEFQAGGSDYFLSARGAAATCTRTTNPDGTCTQNCSGGGTLTIYSNHGSFHGKVTVFPKQSSIGVGWRSVPSGSGQNFTTLADGTFQLATYSPGNNWSVVLNADGNGSGSLDTVWSTQDRYGLRVNATTHPNENALVELQGYKPYYEPPCANCAFPDSEGKPVRVSTGEMYLTHTDAVVGSLVLSRSYSSQRSATGRYGVFGAGWNSSIDPRLSFPEAGVIESRDANGTPSYYVDGNGDGIYEAVNPTDPLTSIETIGGGFRKKHAAGAEELFTTAGRITSATDPAGVVTTYTRDGANRVTSISRQGRSLVFTYGVSVATVKDGANTLLATYSYDFSSRLSAVAYPDGTGYQLGYDDLGRLVFVGDMSGKMIERHEYDSSGRAITSEIDEGQEKYTFTYGDNGTTVTDALGNSTLYEYQFLAGTFVVTRITGPCASCGGGAGDLQEFEFDARANLTKKRDAAGKEWTFTYDSNNQKLSQTDPLNQTTTYTYDSQGRMLTRTGPDGAVTTYVQSPPGPTSITQDVTASSTRTTGITYHPTNGRPETITDPRGKVTTMAYNAATADLTSVTDPLGHATTFGYDALGRRTTVTDALSHTTTTAYDIRGRVTSVINHDGTHTDFTYDQSGRRETVKDPLGRVTRYIYDDFGRLITVLDPLNQATRYAYDLMGNLLTLTDAKNQTTTFEYDGHYRVKKTIYPGGAFETFTYDSRGRLTTMVDRKGTTTTYTYDDVGRLAGKTFSDGTPAFTYAYDIATGRMLTAANGTDTLTWTYNLAGELLSEQSATNSSTVAYTYDDGGNRLSVSLDGTLFVTYAYDDASRLTSITRGTNVFGFAYDNANRRTSMTYPNGVDTTYTYDALNRLTNLAATHTATSTPITNFGYLYDAAGNRTQKSTLDYTEDYGYDPLYRLTRTDRTNPGATPPNQWTWSYDQVGNRTSAQKDSEATTSSYNEKNQLTGATGGGKMLWRGTLDEPGIATFSAPTINGQPARMLAGNVFEATLDLPAGANNVTIQAQDGSGNIATKNYSVNVIGVPSSYTYDANGNLSAKTEGADSWTYTWNALNQLITVSKNAATVATYQYDPNGRRVERVAGATTTAWAYDGEDILSQAATAGGVTTATYFTHGPGTDEPLTQTTGATAEHLHADGLGSITRHTTNAGAISQTISYDAWGNIQTGSPGAYAFTGREWDAPAALHHYRARYYGQAEGRFISEDPARFGGGVNFFAYVLNRPTTLIDPYGLMPSPRACKELADYMARVLRREPNDKYKHCVVSCVLTIVCGMKMAELAGWGKEAMDVIGPGNAEIDDLIADYYGIFCGFKVLDGSGKNCETQCRIKYP